MKIIDWIKNNKVLLFILFISACLRFYKIDYQSVWIDEILSMKNSNPKLSLKELYDSVMFLEFIPHAYFYVLRLFFEVFGFTTVVARSLSAIFGVFGVYAVYLLAKEMFNKKSGLIAASFIAVNIFHISYSQEARPYAMLFLFTVLSFYKLVQLLKKPNYKNAVLYAIFTGLIINSHFFGFITVFSQVLILLTFLVITKKEDLRKTITLYAISGVIFLIFILLLAEPLLRASNINSFWLPQPDAQIYTNMIKEFFGKSELVLSLVYILFLLYFINLTQQKLPKINKESILKEKKTLSFIILSFWLLVSLLISLVKSHLDVPMIISRYFINILPIFILTISFSTFSIKNNFVRNAVISIFIIFSLTDLLFVNKYYTKITKEQFREVTEIIKSKNTNHSKVVTNWGWLIPHLFDDKPTEIVSTTLQEYVNKLSQGNEPIAPFWYFDGHSNPYNLDIQAEDYLKNNYNEIERLDYFDSWARYYYPKAKEEDKIVLNINEFEPIKSDNELNILLFSNSTTTSKSIELDKGSYLIAIEAKSIPDPPINNENAHLSIDLNGQKIGAYFVNEKKESKTYFKFEMDKKQNVKIGLTFGNDLVLDNKDRNLLIYSVVIEKVNN